MEWDFINTVVSHKELMNEALALAKEIIQMPPLSIQAVKKAVNRGKDGYDYAKSVLGNLQKTCDAAEGAWAFLENGLPSFRENT